MTNPAAICHCGCVACPKGNKFMGLVFWLEMVALNLNELNWIGLCLNLVFGFCAL